MQLQDYPAAVGKHDGHIPIAHIRPEHMVPAVLQEEKQSTHKLLNGV
jgi:hypothetical protein